MNLVEYYSKIVDISYTHDTIAYGLIQMNLIVKTELFMYYAKIYSYIDHMINYSDMTLYHKRSHSFIHNDTLPLGCTP